MKINISEIHEQLNKCLSDYLIPSYMMQINSIPVTRNGKLEKANIELSVEDIYRYMTGDVIVYKNQGESGLIDTEFIENKSWRKNRSIWGLSNLIEMLQIYPRLITR